MELAYRILRKRQQLRDLLSYALNQKIASFLVIREAKFQIEVCDLALIELYRSREFYKSEAQ